MLTLSGNQCQCYEDSELFHGPLVVRGGAAVYTGGVRSSTLYGQLE